MSDAMTYESFIRNAFNNCGRYGDPASLADTDTFNDAYSNSNFLNKIKIGTGYAMEVFNSLYRETKKLADPGDSTTMDTLLSKVLAASSPADVVAVINEYREFKEYVKTLPNC